MVLQTMPANRSRGIKRPFTAVGTLSTHLCARSGLWGREGRWPVVMTERTACGSFCCIIAITMYLQPKHHNHHTSWKSVWKEKNKYRKENILVLTPFTGWFAAFESEYNDASQFGIGLERKLKKGEKELPEIRINNRPRSSESGNWAVGNKDNW